MGLAASRPELQPLRSFRIYTSQGNCSRDCQERKCTFSVLIAIVRVINVWPIALFGVCNFRLFLGHFYRRHGCQALQLS